MDLKLYLNWSNWLPNYFFLVVIQVKNELVIYVILKYSEHNYVLGNADNI